MTRASLTLPLHARAGRCVVAVGAFAAGLAPSADGDIWWHLAAGREMVSQRAFLEADPFSSGAAGRAWVDVHWLFQVIAYAVHSWFGLSGLVIAKCLLLSLGATLLFMALRAERPPQRAALVTALLAGLLVARSLLLVRPVIGTLVLLAFFFLQLERFGRDGRARHLVWLLPAQVVWANFQGLSALGPALLGAYALASAVWAAFGQARAWPFGPEGTRRSHASAWQRTRALSLTLLGCSGALWVTPFGVEGAALPAKLLARLLPGEDAVFARQVAENQSPFVLEGVTGGEMWHFKWALLALGVSVLLAGRRLRLSHALILLGLGALAVLSNRNVLLFYWLGAPILAVNVGKTRLAIPRPLRRRALVALSTLNTASVAAILLLIGLAASRETPLSAPAPFRAPNVSAERLATLPRGTGKVFAADNYGGYLIWQLYPRFKPYIDTRLVLRTADEFAEYLRLADEPDRFDAFQARHGFDYVVLPVLFPDRYQRLIGHLYARPDWKLLFADGSEVLFGRRDLTADVPGVDVSESAHLEQALATITRDVQHEKVRAAAQLGLATFYGAVGQLGQARRALRDLTTPEAHALDARILFAQGDLDRAERTAERLLRTDDEGVSNLNLLALIELERGNASRGLSFLRTALERRPFDPEANQLLAQLTRGD